MRNSRAFKKETFFCKISHEETEEESFSGDEVDAIAADYADFENIYLFGDKNSGVKSSGPPQNYAQLRQDNLRNKTKFIDDTFLPENIKLPAGIKKKVVWKRPWEIVGKPELIVDGLSRFDIDQGLIGDCWFLAAVANVTSNEKLMSMVIPMDQRNFSIVPSDANYAGIFHFRFWRYGRWVDVVVDDRLPTVDNQLIFLRSSNPQEFWPSLLEKAYAKFYGSYKALEGGQITEALEDLSGGLSEFYTPTHPQMFEIMDMSYQRSSFMGCSIESLEVEGKRDDGLITTHAYSVTGITTVEAQDNVYNLIRMRNPWGNSSEWNGAWSDHDSQNWSLIPKEIETELRRKRADGEFWMEFNDFVNCFSFLDICHLNPSSFFLADDRITWNVNMFEGTWVPNVTAGGGVQCKRTFANNPQYHITLKGDNSSRVYSVVVGLMQKDRRQIGANFLPLEINIYRLHSAPGKVLDAKFFEKNEPILHKTAIGIRQLTIRVQLPRGRYCIIPSTADPNVPASYLLRVYSQVEANVVENDDEIGYSDTVLNESAPIGQAASSSKRNNEVGWYKVHKTLNKKFAERRMFCFIKPKIEFRRDTCRTLVTLWDTNYNGQLDGDEFRKLLSDITKLKAMFKKFDVDNSGKLDGFELRNLLLSCGYRVNRQILTVIMLRYGNKGTMSFENFVICSFKLKAMIDEFDRKARTETTDRIKVSKRDWLQNTLS